MKNIITLLLITALFNGCMVKKVIKNGHGGKGKQGHSTTRVVK